MKKRSEFPKSDVESMNEFYGDPDINDDGRPDVAWEAENIVRIEPPFPMFWAWNMRPITKISIHKKCAKSLEAILNDIKAEISPEDIEKYHLNRCGGTYNFRMIRGGTRLSMHSWGSAIDLAPEKNPLGRPYKPEMTAWKMMPKKVVQIFERHGWTWGGLWRRPDAMHFQATK